MILASIEGAILTLIIAAVMVVVRWINDRAARQQAEQQQRNLQERRRPAAPAGRDSEEERMRRFMEALGIPADATSAPPPPAPVRQPPPVRREATIRPVPPIVATSRERTESPRSASVPPPMPTLRPSVPEPAPAPRVERPPVPEFSVSQLEVPRAPSFSTEDLQAKQSEVPTSRKSDSSKRSRKERLEEAAPVGAGEEELWRTALSSPAALRSAFILKEILGTPRGLQSGGAAHSFPVL